MDTVLLQAEHPLGCLSHDQFCRGGHLVQLTYILDDVIANVGLELEEDDVGDGHSDYF